MTPSWPSGRPRRCRGGSNLAISTRPSPRFGTATGSCRWRERPRGDVTGKSLLRWRSPPKQVSDAGAYGVHPCAAGRRPQALAVTDTTQGVIPFAWWASACTPSVRPRCASGRLPRPPMLALLAADGDRPHGPVRRLADPAGPPARSRSPRAPPRGTTPSTRSRGPPRVRSRPRRPPAGRTWAARRPRRVLPTTASPRCGPRSDAGADTPTVVLAAPRHDQDPDQAADVHAAVNQMLELVRDFLADERLATSRLVLVTRGALATYDGEPVGDLVAATLHGLFRSARAGCWLRPGRPRARRARRGRGGGAPGPGKSIAVRAGTILVPRLVRFLLDDPRRAAAATAWRRPHPPALHGLALVESPEAVAPRPRAGCGWQIRAAGMNFRDVTSTLGPPRSDVLGGEGLARARRVGPGVTGFEARRPGTVLLLGPVRPLAVADLRPWHRSGRVVLPASLDGPGHLPDRVLRARRRRRPATRRVRAHPCRRRSRRRRGRAAGPPSRRRDLRHRRPQSAAVRELASPDRIWTPAPTVRTQCSTPPTAEASTWSWTRSPTSSSIRHAACCRTAPRDGPDPHPRRRLGGRHVPRRPLSGIRPAAWRPNGARDAGRVAGLV